MRNLTLPKPPVQHIGRWFWRVLIEQHGGAR